MFKKCLSFEEAWKHSRDRMLVRCGFLVNCPDNFPKVDGNFNQLTSDQLCVLFDKMLALPTVNCQGGTKGYFTAVKYPYIIHVYLEVDCLDCEKITFEFFENYVENKLGEANREGQGSANADTIKKAISLMENNKALFEYLRENSIDWVDGSSD